MLTPAKSITLSVIRRPLCTEAIASLSQKRWKSHLRLGGGLVTDEVEVSSQMRWRSSHR